MKLWLEFLFILVEVAASCLATSITSLSPSISLTQPNVSAALIPLTLDATAGQEKAWPPTPYTFGVGRELSLRINYYGDQADDSRTGKILEDLTELQYYISSRFPDGTEFEPLMIRQDDVGVWFRSDPWLSSITTQQAIFVLVGVAILIEENGPIDIADAEVLVGGQSRMGFVLDIW